MNTSVSPSPEKYVPQRTCVACRQVKAKRDLVRIVTTADGGLIVDSTGKKPGRGAYLCKHKECWEKGLKSNNLGNVLRVPLSQQDKQKLKEFAERL
jgi:hypothetical protein